MKITKAKNNRLEAINNGRSYYLGSPCIGCNSKKKHVKNSSCLKCALKYRKSDKSKKVRRNARLIRLYGISEKEYKILFKKQNGNCVICLKKNYDKHGRLHVDHNHITNAFRGLICENCNHGLGCFKDNINILMNAIKYLKKDKVISIDVKVSA